MGQTGMKFAAGAQTGSSFYAATMAKTKIQEQNQQEELQKQLAKIFQQDSEEKKDSAKEQASNKQEYQLPNDSLQLEDMSDFNIAASVGQSLEVGHAQDE